MRHRTKLRPPSWRAGRETVAYQSKEHTLNEPTTVDLRDVNLLDVDQAAQRLGTETRFIRRLVAERRITYYKIGKYVRFHPEDIAEYIREARREAINPVLTIQDGVSAYA